MADFANDGACELLSRPAEMPPDLGELKSLHILGSFRADVDRALRGLPGLLPTVAARRLEAYFPRMLHAEVAEAVGLDFGRSPTPIAKES